jgi:hypothetical protein
VTGLAAYGGCKDASAAWAAGVLAVGTEPAAAEGVGVPEVPEDLREYWEERVAIMEWDGYVAHAEAVCLAWAGLQLPREKC